MPARRPSSSTASLAGMLVATLACLPWVRPAAAYGAAEGPFRDLAAGASGALPARDAAVEAPLPRSFRLVEVDSGALAAALAAAPVEGSGATLAPPLELVLPWPDGSDRRFRVEESPIVEAGLAARYPELRTYVAQGIDDPTATARLSLTPLGFHAMVLAAEGTVFIDPYRRWHDDLAISFFKQEAVRRSGDDFRCEVKGNDSAVDVATAAGAGFAATPVPETPSGATLRTYRLALAATREYSTAVCSPNPAAVSCALAAMVVSMNRVDAIYEREVAVRMVLIANNNLIVYIAEPDPYSNNSGSTMLGQNQTNLDTVIGTANYDVGHVFSTGGGGVASLNVPCTASKARGVTGSSNPVGDGFDVDYVAHEMGHQFGGAHTFNGTTSNCGGGNRSASSAYEPGSGSTIMAYAGICGAEDLQPHSDDTFHSRSFDQIVTFSTGSTGNSCAVSTATGNSAPVVNAGAAFTIPKQTPFTLTGSATDADGDALTFMWEEYDLGTAAPPNDDIAAVRPIFRSFVPLTTPSRTFPKLSDILANVAAFGESMSTRNRTMTFRLTARDNRVGGGGVDRAATTVTVAAAAGPFVVTSPNSAITWTGGTSEAVTWNVAGTDAVPVSCASVAIDLSTDGGNSFTVALDPATANDGAATITVPNAPTTQARVRVSCNGNVFFDIGNANFTIAAGAPPPNLISILPVAGSEWGGTVVTLAGSSFVNGATVSFDGTPATLVTFNDSTSIFATAPAHAVGAVDVAVENPDAQSDTLVASFTYLPDLPFADGFETADLSRWSVSLP